MLPLTLICFERSLKLKPLPAVTRDYLQKIPKDKRRVCDVDLATSLYSYNPTIDSIRNQPFVHLIQHLQPSNLLLTMDSTYDSIPIDDVSLQLDAEISTLQSQSKHTPLIPNPIIYN